jgi:hypothetical protein
MVALYRAMLLTRKHLDVRHPSPFVSLLVHSGRVAADVDDLVQGDDAAAAAAVGVAVAPTSAVVFNFDSL